MHSGNAGSSDWLGVLAECLYLSDSIADKTILVLGCGRGVGCEFLANQGARHVYGVDDDRELIAEARIHHALVNVEYRVRGYAGLELEDDSVDIVFAYGAELLRKSSVVQELRRVLRFDGQLLWSVPSADRVGASGGVSFHEFGDRLGETFGEHRMIAVQPMVALSIVDYAELDPEIELDTTLARLGSEAEEVTGYLAVFGDVRARVRPYSVIQLPSREGLSVVGGALGVAASDAERLRGDLERERQGRHRAESTLSDLKIRVAELERGYAAEVQRALGVDASLALEADLSSSLREAPGTQTEDTPGPGPEELHEALEAHFNLTRELEGRMAELEEFTDELESDKKQLADETRSLRDALTAETERVATMREQLGSWRDRTARAEGELLGLRLRQQGHQVPLAQGTDVGLAVQALHQAQERLGEQRALATELERGLREVAAAAAELGSGKEGAVGAKLHQLQEVSSELGSREAEVVLLTVGLRSLKERLKGAAGELEMAMELEAEERVRKIVERIANQLRMFSEV